MLLPPRASRIALAATAPVVLAQGRAVRRSTPLLPEANGPATVHVGAGDAPVRLLVLGDSTVAGIGVATHVEGLTGGLARELAGRVDRPVAATAIGRGGATTRDLVTDFLTDAAHEKRAPVTKAAVLAAMGTARLAKDSLGRTVARRQPKGDAVTLVRVAPPIDLTESETAA